MTTRGWQYWRSLRARADDYLTIRDYLWRWDTDWFWCSRNVGAQLAPVRLLAGPRLLSSVTYQKIMRAAQRYPLKALEHLRPRTESVIQDVDIPLARAASFLAQLHARVGITPVWVCPFRVTADRYPLYRLRTDTPYVNFGCFQRKQDPIERAGEKFPGFFNNKNSVEKYLGKIFLSAVLFYISVRLFLFHIYPAPLPAGDAALLPESDARSYLLLSKLPLLSKALLFGGRPPGYPVFLKIFSGNFNFIYSTQFVISSVSAVLFMRIMYRLIKNSYLKILTLIGLVIFFLNPNLMIWDKWVLAESLSFSIFFLLFFLLLATAQKPRIYDLLFIAALWICWGSLRDGNISSHVAKWKIRKMGKLF